LIINVQI